MVLLNSHLAELYSPPGWLEWISWVWVMQMQLFHGPYWQPLCWTRMLESGWVREAVWEGRMWTWTLRKSRLRKAGSRALDSRTDFGRSRVTSSSVTAGEARWDADVRSDIRVSLFLCDCCYIPQEGRGRFISLGAGEGYWIFEMWIVILEQDKNTSSKEVDLHWLGNVGWHLKNLIMNVKWEPLASLSFSLVTLSCQGASAEEIADVSLRLARWGWWRRRARQ